MRRLIKKSMAMGLMRWGARFHLSTAKSYHPLGEFAGAGLGRPDDAFWMRWRMVASTISEFGARSFCDLGCAEGFYVRQAAREFEVFSVGVDSDPERLRTALALCQMEGDWSAGFVQMELTSRSLESIPRFDIIACMSLLHHIIFAYDLEEAKNMLKIIAKKVNKCMVFDMGGPGERGSVWASSLSMLDGNVDCNIKNLLTECGFFNIKLLGHTVGYSTEEKRAMFVAEGAGAR